MDFYRKSGNNRTYLFDTLHFLMPENRLFWTKGEEGQKNRGDFSQTAH